MKKALSLILAVLLLASLSTAAFAQGYSESYDQMGFTLTYPEEYETIKGVIETFPMGRVMDGLYYMVFEYYAMPKEDYQRLANTAPELISDEEYAAAMDAQGVLLYVFGIDGGRDAAAIIEMAELEGISPEEFTEVGRAGDVTFYIYEDAQYAEEYAATLTPEFAEEFNMLREKMAEAMKNAQYAVPVVPGAGLVGQKLQFETTDLDGNVVKSEEIFAQHQLTMVNVWATWCGPCKGELAGLGEMNRRLAEKDVAVIGICLDADEKTEFCRSLLEENGVDYLNLLPFENAAEELDVTSFPTSYFVDREGRVLGLPVLGAPAEMSYYETVIEGLLNGETVNAEAAEPAQSSEGNSYSVKVTDPDGNPVEGAMVQLCTDVSCTMGKTDAEGIALFEVEEGTGFTIHILKAPAGYEKTDEGFTFQDGSRELTVVLQKAA